MVRNCQPNEYCYKGVSMDVREEKINYIVLNNKEVTILKSGLYIGMAVYLDKYNSWMLIDLNTRFVVMSPDVLIEIADMLIFFNRNGCTENNTNYVKARSQAFTSDHNE